MPKLFRTCAALCLALLTATVLGAAGQPQTQTPRVEHTVAGTDGGDTIVQQVNNTGSTYHPPATTI